MRKNGLLAIVFFISGYAACFAQLKIKQSDLIVTSKGTSFITAGKRNDNVFVIQRKKNNMALTSFNSKSLKISNQNLFKQKHCKGVSACIDNDYDYHSTRFFPDRTIMFFQTYDKDKSKLTFYAQDVNKKGELKGGLVKLDAHPEKNRYRHGTYWCYPSIDTTKFLVVYNTRMEDKHENEKFKFKIYDLQFDNLNNFEARLPYEDENVIVKDYYLSRDNTVYMLCKIEKERKEREKGEARDFYSVLVINPETSELSEFKLSIPSKEIVTIQMRLNKKGDRFSCVGLYAEIKGNRKRGKEIDGVFYLTVDSKNMEILSKSFKKLDSDLSAQLEGKKKKKKKKGKKDGISKDFEIMEMIYKDDGSITVLAEYRDFYITTYTTCNSQGGCTTRYIYHYIRNNVFVINISPEGEVLSMIDIPKYQHTTDDGGQYSSFCTYRKDDRIIIIYNDNPKNLSPEVKTIRDCKPMSNVMKSVLIAVEVKPDGSYTKQIIYDNNEKNFIPMPEDGMHIENGVYVIPAYYLKIVDIPIIGYCFTFVGALFSKQKTSLLRITLD